MARHERSGVYGKDGGIGYSKLPPHSGYLPIPERIGAGGCEEGEGPQAGTPNATRIWALFFCA
jgi:hypothetical protein